MKKRIASLLVAALLCLLTGCTPKSAPLPENENYPMEFVFSSGAGAWGTHLTLYSDGSFTGQFSDANMGETGKNYPNGTVYHCSFTGTFTMEEPLDIHSYPMTLTEVTAEPTASEEQIVDGVLYVTAGPYGLYNDSIDGDGSMSRNFMLYAPTAPVFGLDEELLSWWPGRYEQTPPETLSCWALWNMDAGTAFFTDLQITN